MHLRSKHCALILCAAAAAPAGAQNDAARQAFVALVDACRAAVAAEPARKVIARPAGGFALLVNAGAAVEAADAQVVASIVTPAVGWIRIASRTQVARFDSREAAEAGRADQPAAATATTLRLAWVDGRWQLRGGSIATVPDAPSGARDLPVELAPATAAGLQNAVGACARVIPLA